MGILKQARMIPTETIRRQRTEIVYESDEQVSRIVHHYEDGTRRVIEGAELDSIASGETVKTWRALARRLGKALDGEAGA